MLVCRSLCVIHQDNLVLSLIKASQSHIMSFMCIICDRCLSLRGVSGPQAIALQLEVLSNVIVPMLHELWLQGVNDILHFRGQQ